MAPSAEGCTPGVRHVPIEGLSTSLQALRQGTRRPPPLARELAELPIRVVRYGDQLEVIDGFKRLARWRAGGATSVPVVIESQRELTEAKVALLTANTPPRTLTAMDEARVADALRHDGLSVVGIAEVTGRKKHWVVARLALASQLSSSAQQRVDAGTLGPTLAHALCALPHDAQDKIVASVERHRLKVYEGLALVSAWRATDSSCDRKRLLDDPLDIVRQLRRSVSPLGALGASLAGRLERVRAALEDVRAFALPKDQLDPAELRRLEADWRQTLHELTKTALALGLGQPTEKNSESRSPRRAEPRELGHQPVAQRHAEAKTTNHRRPETSDHEAAQGRVRHAQDRGSGRLRSQECPKSAPGGGPLGGSASPAETVDTQQARRLQGDDPGAGREGAEDATHLARDPRERLHRRSHDRRRVRASVSSSPEREEGPSSLRDQAG